jgi:hypothetical protein
MADDKFITDKKKILKMHNFQEIQLHFRKKISESTFFSSIRKRGKLVNLENKNELYVNIHHTMMLGLTRSFCKRIKVCKSFCLYATS